MSTPSIDHESCSSLLRARALGRLDDGTRRAVDLHLQECDDCRLEERAVTALLKVPDERLSDVERGRLHDALESAAPRTAALRRERRPPHAWRSKLAPALAAAAVLAVLAVGVAQLSGGGGAVSSGGSGGAVESRQNGPVPSSDHRAGSRGPAATAATPGGVGLPHSGPDPHFVAGPRALSSADVDHIALSSTPYSRAYDVADAARLGNDFLNRLAREAPASLRGDVLACGRSELAAGHDLLPVVATFGRVGGRDLVLVGFVGSPTPEPPTRGLTSFEMLGWPPGSCRLPATFDFRSDNGH